MGQTTDFVEFTDSTTDLAPAGRARFRLHGGVIQQSVDGGAWATVGAGGGGSGTVTSVAATAAGLLAVAGTPTIAPTVGMAAMADQTVVGNVSGGSAVPIALTATQQRTMLSVQASNAVAITGGTITGTTIALNAAQLSDGPVSVTGATGVLNSPALTGLTATATTFLNDLIVGKAGGQTVIGGTAANENLTLASTSNATKGSIILGNSSTGLVYSVGSNYIQMGGNIASSIWIAELIKNQNNSSVFALTNTNASAASQVAYYMQNGTGYIANLSLLGSGFTTAGFHTAGSLVLGLTGGTGNLVLEVGKASGDLVVTTGASPTQKLRVYNAGNVTVGGGLATTATDGFFYVPSGAGPPTGVPTSPTLDNNVPIYIDRTNKKLYMYVGGWVGGTAPGVFV